MNAETPKAEDLNLPQAVLLLATNDADGEPMVPQTVLRAAVAGAILAELELLGAIALQGKHVRATGTVPETDFQHQLELIRDKTRPHTPKRWVAMLESRAELHRVYEEMVALGIVEHVGERHLGVFRTTRYPEKDHASEAALLQKIQAALRGAPAGPTPADAGSSDARLSDTARADASPTDARTAALVALLHSAGLLEKILPAPDQSRARGLAHDYWPAHALADELRMIKMAEAEAVT